MCYITRINRTGRLSLALIIGMVLILSLPFSATNLNALVAQQWDIVNFAEHGTRRLIEVDGNRWFFYRPEANRELTLEVEGGKILIRSATRDEASDLSFQIRVNNSYRTFRVRQIDTYDPFSIMENVFLNLGPGTHTLRISTTDRLAYFKVFREAEVWTVPTVKTAFEPQSYIGKNTLVSDDSESPYYSADNSHPLQFEVTGPNEVSGFSRFIASTEDDTESKLDIYVNAQLIETVTIPNRLTGSYHLKESPDQDLSIGRKIEVTLPAGDHKVRIVPRDNRAHIFRLFMDVPEDIPAEPERVYEVSLFKEPTLAQRVMTGFELSAGTTIGYNDNVFSLSEYDRQRFDEGNQALTSFVDSADDLIVNPYIRGRYPVNLGEYTVTPYINLNYYQYLNNSEKTNYSILSGLFNSYGNFNLNLYYGYYADLYVRDYSDTDGTEEYENFIYEKNLYRLYSYFSLGRLDTPLLYLQVEDYYHSENFTEYDGTATTFGLGWRRSFPTFYLRFFYYYRDFAAANTDYVLEDVTSNDRITDPTYESNIYDFQFRNKLVNLSEDHQIRPYFGFRFENRFYTTDLPVNVSPFQSTRNDKRYRFSAGCEFYLIDNFIITLDYNYFLRDSYSDNDSVAKYKDYSQQSISVDLEYKISF